MRRRVLLIYGLSGFVSLGYQVAWFRLFADCFGSTNVTFGLVVANFIAGLGLGSLASERGVALLGRLTGLRDRLRLYGLVEILVGLSALATLVIVALPPDFFGAESYRLVEGIHQPTATRVVGQALASILGVFLPCLFMGATFPLLCRIYQDEERFPARLYGWNTLGACAGILACEFVLLPRFGQWSCFLIMALVNLAFGLYFLLRGGAAAGGSIPSGPGSEPPAAPRLAPTTARYAAVIGGLVTGAFEADVLRRLQFLDCRSDAALSCISFWAILAIFLGSSLISARPRLRLGHSRLAFALALGLQVLLWSQAYELREWVGAADRARVIATLPPDSTGLGVTYDFGHFRQGLGPVFAFTGLFVLPPFLLLSLLLPQVCVALQRERRHLGQVYGLNTLAFCLGLLAFTFVAPGVDVFYSLGLFPWVFAALVVGLFLLPDRGSPRWYRVAAPIVLVVAAIVLVPAGFDADLIEPGSSARLFPVRGLRSNGAHTTYVVADPRGDFLYFDSHTMSGCNEPAQRYMRLMAHFPLLAQEHPRSALLICFGVGNTASAIAAHEEIERVDVVDLNDQVLLTAPEFAATNHDVIEDPRLVLYHDDGRRFLRLTDRRYDLITSEPPPPMFAGMFRLYSREYYEDARDHLNENGLMSQWLPISQMPRAAVEKAVATFLAVFPESCLLVGSDTNYILVGGTRPIDYAMIEKRFAPARGVVRDLVAVGVLSPMQLLARVVLAAPSLERDFGGGPTISDTGIGFAHDFEDPADPPRIRLRPARLLEEIGAEHLACAGELRSTLLDLGRLTYFAPDFPITALDSIVPTEQPEVFAAGLDYRSIARLIEVARANQTGAGAESSARLLTRAAELGRGQLVGPLVQLADLLAGTGKLDRSLEAWKRIEARIGPGPASRYRTALLLQALGRHDEALAAVDEAIALDVAGLGLLQRLRGDLLEALGRLREAERAYRLALELDPQDDLARRALGQPKR